MPEPFGPIDMGHVAYLLVVLLLVILFIRKSED